MIYLQFSQSPVHFCSFIRLLLIILVSLGLVFGFVFNFRSD